MTGGWSAAGWSVAGCLLGALLFFPMFALRGMGAGDVKLLAAVGAWLGPGQVAMAALATSIAGGVIALAVALGHGYLTDGLPQSVDAADHTGASWAFARCTSSRSRVRAVRASPTRVPIAIGTLVTLWLK